MKFSNEFKCLMDKCPNTCCSSEIKLSMIDLLRLKPVFKKDSYFVSGHRVELFFNHCSGLPFGLLSDEGELCPLFSEGLCSCYENRPLVCRAYPYMIFFPEVCRLKLNSGCSEVPAHQWEYVSKGDVASIVKEFKEHELAAAMIKQYSMNKLAGLISNGELVNFLKKLLIPKSLECLGSSVG